MDRESVLTEANNLISEKNFLDAKTKLNSFLENNPSENSVEFQKTLRLCNVNLECMLEAKEKFEKVIEIA